MTREDLEDAREEAFDRFDEYCNKGHWDSAKAMETAIADLDRRIDVLDARSHGMDCYCNTCCQ